MSKLTLGGLLFLSLFIGGCNEPPKPAQTVESEAKTEVAKKQPMPTEPACSITMGWDPWEPYMYLMPGNKVSGLDIEIISALAEEADCDLNFVQDDWMSLLQKVEKGEVDMVAGASITEKRKKYALFSEPYRRESFVMYVRAGEQDNFSENIKSIASAGKTIGLTTDYIYGDQVSNLQDSPDFAKQFVYSPVGEANFYNLLQHNVDVVVEDPFVGAYNLKRKGLSDQIDQLDITIHSGEVHLMFSMQSVDHTTVASFNKALETIKANGTYQDILKKYLL